MTPGLFRGVDHIMARVADAGALTRFFSEKLGLPVSWPLQRSEFATYGWITLGNANLEFWAAADNGDLPENCKPPVFHGFALDPESLVQSVAVLSARGVACKAPRPYVTVNPSGAEVTNFTNAVILDASSPSCCVFFCEWGADGTIFPWPEKLTSVQRQAREAKALADARGGALGVIGLREIRMATPDISNAMSTWRAITGDASGPIHLGRGVRLDLVEGSVHKIESIALAVRSLATARKFLSERGLLGEDREDELSLSRTVCENLHVRLREA